MTLFPEKQITERLKVIAESIQSNHCFADIGSDHGYLPCYVCSRDKTVQAIVGEVNVGPLKNAQANIKKYGLEDQIKPRLGSGLSILKETDKVNQIVIAGMGGKLIQHILEEDLEIITPTTKLILQPNNKAPDLRQFLMENNFKITEEKLVVDNQIIYEIIEAEKSETPVKYSDREILLGPQLFRSKSELFYKKWTEEHSHLKNIVNQMQQSKNIDTIKLKAYQNMIAIIEEEI